MHGNQGRRNIGATHWSGGVYSSWVLTFNRTATTIVASDGAEHIVLSDTVPRDSMASLGQAIRLTARFFGSLINGALTIRLKFGTATLATVTVPSFATGQTGVLVWELGQVGTKTARCNQMVRLTNSTGTTISEAAFDAAFDTSLADKDVSITMQIADAADTASAAHYSIEHHGW